MKETIFGKQLSSLDTTHGAKEKQEEKQQERQQERLQVHQDEDSSKGGEDSESGEVIGAGIGHAFTLYRGKSKIFPMGVGLGSHPISYCIGINFQGTKIFIFWADS